MTFKIKNQLDKEKLYRQYKTKLILNNLIYQQHNFGLNKKFKCIMKYVIEFIIIKVLLNANIVKEHFLINKLKSIWYFAKNKH
jgi:hypothetical protein